MSKKVCITGYGVICAIGNNADECFSALKSQKHGVSLLKNIRSRFQDNLLVGEVKLNNHELFQLAQLKKISTNSRGTLLGIIAAKQAVSHAKLSAEELKTTALISGTSVGGMDLFEQGYQGVIDKNIERPNYFFSEHDCGNLNAKIATELGLQSYTTCISTACSSSANAILLGARMIKNGLVKRAIVGGSDALSKFTINGFHSLGILSEQHTTPFDKNRTGLNLGEGAAYLILEAEDVCANKETLGIVAGWGNANDAFHQTASSESGDGSILSIKKALKTAGILATEIDYINTHGTGTGNNDFSESVAMKTIFGKNVPNFNSLKPFTGHTLAACGSIEAIFSLFSMNENILFKSLNFQTPIEETNLTPVLETLENIEIKNVLSNSFGFGGNCTSLIFTKE